MRRSFGCLLVLWFSLLSGTAHAQTAPTLTLQPESVQAGYTFTASGSGWDGDCRVDLTLDTPNGPAMGSAVPVNGSFSVQAGVDVATAPGGRTVVATGRTSGFESNCAASSGRSAEADIEVVAAEPIPIIQFDRFEAVAGDILHITGDGFCSDSGCSPVDIFIGGRLMAEILNIDSNGSFEVDVVVPSVSPVGDTLIIASQTLPGGDEARAFGDIYTKVRSGGPRPTPGFTRPSIDASQGNQPPPSGPNVAQSSTGGASGNPSFPGGLLAAMALTVSPFILLGGRRIGPGLAHMVSAAGAPFRLVTAAWSKRRKRRFRLCGLTALLLVSFLTAVPSIAIPPPSAITDVNPDGLPGEPRFGGRAMGLTVDPTNAGIVWVSSELGGIWRSTNGGTNWGHEDQVPLTIARDISFDPQDANILIASGSYDGGATNNGGIWRSTNGGGGWAKPATSNPACLGGNASTWGIAIPNDPVAHTNVFVATDCGLAVSPDSGATWNHIDPCPPAAGCAGNGSYFDVEARVVGGNVQLDVCGNEGYFRSPDGGATWSLRDPASPALPPNFNPCHVATAPNDPNTVYLANWSGTMGGFCVSQLVESTAAGAAGSWVQMGITASNCRDAWVVTTPDPGGDANLYQVYFGTSQRVTRQLCDLTAAPSCAVAAASWPTVDSGAHSDPSDLAFDPADPDCPIVLSTDGGISTSGDCGLNWVDGNRGYHALDLAGGMAGVVHGAHTDLYIATQDNGLYVSADNAATWSRPVGADAYNVYADTDRVLYRQCFGCSNQISDEHVVGAGAFSNPPGTIGTFAAATQFGPQSYAFITSDGGTPAVFSVWVTVDEGANWTQMGANLPGSPGEIKSAGPAATPTFHVRLNVAGQRQLYRLSGPLDGTATTTLASPPGAWIDKWDVDPSDPTRLYASDLQNQQMIFSTTSGSTWTPDLALTNLITQAGAYPFVANNLGNQVSSVTLDPASAGIVVGSRTAGSVVSLTDGATWAPIPGGQQIPLYKDAFFDPSDGSIYLGTQGRGIWRAELPQADLAVTKTDSPDPVPAGSQLTYTISINNGGPDTANETKVVDVLPSVATYVSTTFPGGCVEAPPGTVACSAGDLGPGVSNFTITVQIAPDAVLNNGGVPLNIENTATVSSLVPDANAANDSDTEATQVVAEADLSIVKNCTPDPVAPGGILDCTLDVTNSGPSFAQNLTVTDDLPENVEPQANPTGGGFTCVTQAPDPETTCTKASQGLVTSQITYSVFVSEDTAPGTSFTNTATVSSTTTDPDPANNTEGETSSIPDCTIVGTGASETINGTAGNDVICANGGHDKVDGKEGDDIIIGGAGDDKLIGGAGDDTLVGGTGKDTLDGGAGNDRIFGGLGDDSLNGGTGNDQLFGREGSDSLNGGGGNDSADGGPQVDSCSAETRLNCE